MSTDRRGNPLPDTTACTAEATPAPGAVETAAATRLVLRPLANPLSLGYLGLAFATLVFSGIQLHLVPADQTPLLALAVLVFTVPVQLISCVFGFLTRDLVAASGMGVLAGTWAAVAAITLQARQGVPSAGLALIVLVAAATLAVPAVAAGQTKLLAAAVCLGTAVRWGLTAGYELSGTVPWRLSAGVAGVALGLFALYASLAFELEDQRRRTVLPTFRRGPGLVAMRGDLAEQVARAANEAGVRRQL